MHSSGASVSTRWIARGKAATIFKRALWGFALLALSLQSVALQDRPASGTQNQDQTGVSGEQGLAVQAQGKKRGVQTPEISEELTAAFVHLIKHLEQDIQMPPARQQSRILPLLPEKTSLVVSIGNYGDVLHQAQQIFHQELESSRVLREWWQKIQKGDTGPGPDEIINQVVQLSQYLGDEIVLSGELSPKNDSPLIMAQIKKPGLKVFLQKLLASIPARSKAPFRVYDPQTLLAAKGRKSGDQAVVLVRPDFVLLAFDVASLREFNGLLNRRGTRFDSTPLGQQVTQAYQQGVGALLAVALKEVMGSVPRKDRLALEQSGFADLQYLIFSRKDVGGEVLTEGKLLFSGPRKGIASWLGAPAAMGSMDFVSPQATAALDIVLKDPSVLWEDVRQLLAADPSSTKGAAELDNVQQALQIDFKKDLVGRLGNELAIAIDNAAIGTPSWKAMLAVRDPEGLQQVLNRLFAAIQANSNGQGPSLERSEEGGMVYYTVHLPQGAPFNLNYTFADGYMVLAPTPPTLAATLRLHKNGESLAKSGGFQSAFPQSGSRDASMLLYQNIGPLMSTMAQQFPPSFAPIFQLVLTETKPSVISVYAEESAIRIATRSQGFEPTSMLIGAAIAIPNLIRSRNAANEAAAASTVRTLNTVEVTYQVTYARYAPDMATLGPSPGGTCTGKDVSEKHACLLDATLGGPACAAGKWCDRDAYRYSITTNCGKGACDDYVISATPADANAGTRSFCSTSDAVVRFKSGVPLESPVSASECQTWEPM